MSCVAEQGFRNLSHPSKSSKPRYPINHHLQTSRHPFASLPVDNKTQQPPRGADESRECHLLQLDCVAAAQSAIQPVLFWLSSCDLDAGGVAHASSSETSAQSESILPTLGGKNLAQTPRASTYNIASGPRFSPVFDLENNFLCRRRLSGDRPKMGNNSTREARGPDAPSPLAHRQRDAATGIGGPSSPTDRVPAHSHLARNGRGPRHDLSFLGIGGSNHSNPTSAVPERRETRQEREARKLEKERIAREKERERSIREEHVDGGYLVTMGVYTGIEDFSKPVVRQLMIERRLAPFWRGLNDFKEDWTEYQLIAAGRGFPIPAADEIPPEDLMRPMSPDSPHVSTPNLQNLTVPITGRTHSTSSDASANPALSLPTSPIAPTPSSSLPFRPRSKTLASLTSSSKNATPPPELTPREIILPKDPFVNGQAVEVFLYKDAVECPICFLYYPPYLNKTRCCDQPICSECFVQIKRPDPHPPEHHEDPSNQTSQPSSNQGTTEAQNSTESELLVSEPSTCPYCQQPEFGVIYEPPPFRRGLTYVHPQPTTFSSPVSSSTSLNSSGSPNLAPAAASAHRRRTTSISATSSMVITTDQVRPDWATKLASARAHLARRAAAATALHTAAYLIGNGTNDSRGFGFSGRSRFSRNRGENSPNASGTATPSTEPTLRSVADQLAAIRREAQENGGQRRRSRMDDLEDMMMMEAIRLSLAAEEERKKKAEKEAAKDARKKAKEDRKREKRERKGVYGSGTSSASGSTLSLSLPVIGRRRGNSAASNLGRELIPEAVDTSPSKGKSVERPSPASGTSTPAPSSSTGDVARIAGSLGPGSGIPGARHLDTTFLTSISDIHPSSPSPTAPDKPSHLRQMSNASSAASSFVDSTSGSIRDDHEDHGQGSSSDIANGGRQGGGEQGMESMFNFRSLAAMIGTEEDKDMAKHIEHLNGDPLSHDKSSSSTPPHDSDGNLEDSIASIATLKPEHSNESNPGNNSRNGVANKSITLLERQYSTPEVMITPVTPAALTSADEDSKQIGAGWGESGGVEITQ
ncbi:hypothetical protein B7463_g12071, partial [Scytalidium lignicola]